MARLQTSRQMSEITEEQVESASFFWEDEDLKNKIRRIVDYQKSRYSSSSSSSMSAASCPSFSSSSKNLSLLNLMRNGSSSLRRLFEMEHTSLATHFEKYSGSPTIKPIPLYVCDDDDEVQDSWAVIRQSRQTWREYRSSDDDTVEEKVFKIQNSRNVKVRKQKLKRIKSFRSLPGFGLQTCSGFRLRLRLRRLRIMICGRKF